MYLDCMTPGAEVKRSHTRFNILAIERGLSVRDLGDVDRANMLPNSFKQFTEPWMFMIYQQTVPNSNSFSTILRARQTINDDVEQKKTALLTIYPEATDVLEKVPTPLVSIVLGVIEDTYRYYQDDVFLRELKQGKHNRTREEENLYYGIRNDYSWYGRPN